MDQEIQVARQDLLDAISSLGGTDLAKSTGEAVLSMRDSELVLVLQGAQVSAPASGEWLGEARFPARFLGAIARVPPRDELVVIRLDGGRLRVATSAVQAIWQAKGSKLMELAIDATLIDVLRFAATHSTEELVRSGLAARVERAFARQAGLVRKAAHALAELGVTHEDLIALVGQKLTSK